MRTISIGTVQQEVRESMMMETALGRIGLLNWMAQMNTIGGKSHIDQTQMVMVSSVMLFG